MGNGPMHMDKVAEPFSQHLKGFLEIELTAVHGTLQDERWCHAQLDELADQIGRTLPPTRYPMKVLEAVTQHLYQDLGYHGVPICRNPVALPPSSNPERRWVFQPTCSTRGIDARDLQRF